MPTITVKRPMERATLLRAYRVRVDGEDAARLRAGETTVVKVEPGVHIVEMRIDFFRKQMELTLADGDYVVMECSSSINPITIWADLFSGSRDSLRLEVVAPQMTGRGRV